MNWWPIFEIENWLSVIVLDQVGGRLKDITTNWFKEFLKASQKQLKKSIEKKLKVFPFIIFLNWVKITLFYYYWIVEIVNLQVSEHYQRFLAIFTILRFTKTFNFYSVKSNIIKKGRLGCQVCSPKGVLCKNFQCYVMLCYVMLCFSHL